MRRLIHLYFHQYVVLAHLTLQSSPKSGPFFLGVQSTGKALSRMHHVMRTAYIDMASSSRKPRDLFEMNTERASPRYSRIDVWDAPDILDCVLEGQFAAVAAVHAARPAIVSAALALEERLQHLG